MVDELKPFMVQVFKPRYPTRNAGFWFAFVSAALSYGVAALLVIGLLNNNTARTFDVSSALIVIGVTLIALAGTTWLVYRIMSIKPIQIRLEADRLLIEDLSSQPARPEADIPFDRLTWVSVTDVAVEGGLFPASFKGLALRWQPAASSEGQEEAEPQEYVISSRNVCDFDELFDRVFNLVPKNIRGARTFRP